MTAHCSSKIRFAAPLVRQLPYVRKGSLCFQSCDKSAGKLAIMDRRYKLNTPIWISELRWLLHPWLLPRFLLDQLFRCRCLWLDPLECSAQCLVPWFWKFTATYDTDRVKNKVLKSGGLIKSTWSRNTCVFWIINFQLVFNTVDTIVIRSDHYPFDGCTYRRSKSVNIWHVNTVCWY